VNKKILIAKLLHFFIWARLSTIERKKKDFSCDSKHETAQLKWKKDD